MERANLSKSDNDGFITPKSEQPGVISTDIDIPVDLSPLFRGPNNKTPPAPRSVPLALFRCHITNDVEWQYDDEVKSSEQKAG
jgi:hypothetical protein